jgi:phosphohistidine phosphatase
VTGAKQLYILRHAKSSWDDQLAPDHDRALAARGRRAVVLIAEYMRDHEVDPQLVLCSSARRTRETLEGVLPGHRGAQIEPGLYGASAGELLDRLHRVPAAVSSVLVVGHNPSVQKLVLKLTGAAVPAGRWDEPESPLQLIERKFPTGALATLAFDGRWSDLSAGGARLIDYVRPKALA